MLICRYLTVVYICVSSMAYSQITDDFIDGELLSNPTWLGDVDDFIISNRVLNLNASEGGTSRLYTAIDVVDDYEWTINFKLDFSPSANNQLLIHLWSETENFEENSLSILMGENGSDDPLTLLDLSSNTILAEGIPTRVANDPVDLELKISYSSSFLVVQSKTSEELLFTQEFEVFIGDIILGEGFFGIECRYTASRADNFSFNQISAGMTIPDTKAPTIVETLFIPENQFCLIFDEAVDLDESNVQLDAGSLQLDDIALQINQVKFSLPGEIPPDFELEISGVIDFEGNELDTSIIISPTFIPELGDLLINEILFNPKGDGGDFVELINTTSRALNLQDLIILNSTNDRQVTISTALEIPPQGLIALTPNPRDIISAYHSTAADRIFSLSLPAFNNGDGNVTILLRGQVLDEFDYDEDFHNALLDDVDGVSLERISLDGPTNDPGNWTSASETVGFATPGSPNSTGSDVNDDLSIEIDSSFSPNGDNQEDKLDINIKARPGFLGTINIYNDAGSHILTLASNTLLGADNVIQWDGNLENGDRAPMGIYIIHVSLFDPEGRTESKKQAVALRDFIN